MDGQQMQLGDWLDDLCVRFLINLPTGDLSSVERICFNAEEAHWYYEDFVRPTDASLPAMTLRTFCLAFFKHCPLLAQFSPEEHVSAFEKFILYKQRVPVRGVILLNPEMDSTILVKGWKKGSSWSFPRGKIAKDEPDMVCAIREAWEETGLDVRAAGLVPEGAEPKSIDITMKDSEIRLFVFRDVPMDTHFEPQTRKEISKIQWFKLSDLPSFKKKGAQNKNQQQSDAGPNVNRFFMVAPFVNPLKKWIATQKKIDAKRLAGANNIYLNPAAPVDEDTVDSDYYSHQQPLASEYLQHPYNTQPLPQHVQPAAAPNDKASALLSMLQPKVPNASALNPQDHGIAHQHIPHTPQELTTGEIPQPRNPHHHTNQHHSALQGNQPPPAFHIDQHKQHAQHGQPLQYNYYGKPYQHQDSIQKENVLRQQEAPQADVRQVQANQAPLVHPQPLPPQVQRAVFNQSVFQEKSPNMPAAQIPQQHHHQAQSGQPPQSNVQPNSGRPMQLNGQSMALLNAFKSDTGPSPSAQPEQPAQQQAQVQQAPAPSQYPHYNAPAPAPQHIPQPQSQQPPVHIKASPQYPHYGQPPLGSQVSELSASVEQKQSQRPSFSGQGPTDQQRSALLDMFKSKPAAGQAPKVPTPGSQASGRGPGMEQQLLDTLRRAPTEAVHPKPEPQPVPQPKAQPTAQQVGALADLLAYRPRPDQPEAMKPQTQNVASTVHRQPSASSNPAAPQPIRILQRGQGLDALANAQQPSYSASQHSPYSNHSMPRTGSYASPPIAPSQPSPGMSHQQPQATSDQKNRLLSLFGKQQQQPKPAGNSASPSVVEAGSGQGTPGRPGSSAPMSPAEQTFLLDYLQSVTNGSKRS